MPIFAQSIEFASHSEAGHRRECNEDFVRCERLGAGALLVLCDGVGGAKAGEVASRMAGDGMHTMIAEWFAGKGAPADRRAWLNRAALELDRTLREAGRAPGLSGMGSTLSALWIESSQAWWVHAGDSRIYLLRNGRLRQISHDQSPVGRLRLAGQLSEEAARRHPFRHMIDQCLGGSGPAVNPDSGEFIVMRDDVFLLCSDGLTDGLWDRDIEEILHRPEPPAEIARTLVSRANEANGNDNISAIVARVQPAPLPASRSARDTARLLTSMLRRYLAAPPRNHVTAGGPNKPLPAHGWMVVPAGFA